MSDEAAGCLILGIGNVLMGDEGVGVRVVEHLMRTPVPSGIRCLDGGTGGFHLLGELQAAEWVVLVDATVDGSPPGRVRQLRPKFSSEYPRTLTAHDIGLKDLLDAIYLLGDPPDVTLFAVSIAEPRDMGTELSRPLSALVPELAQRVMEEAVGLSSRHR